MLYYTFKTLHVIVGCFLLAVVVWSIWPAQRAGDELDMRLAFRRGLWVIPLGVVQAVLGMVVLSIEPIAASMLQMLVLIGGFFVLGLLWLLGLGAARYLSLNQQSAEATPRTIRIFTHVWVAVISLVFLVMLYVMANFR